MKTYEEIEQMPKNGAAGLQRIGIVRKLFRKSTDRTGVVRRNIIQNLLVKGLSVLISFLMVRVTYDFLEQSEVYGVWLTILGVLSWISIFDFGLGNGLRNKLAEKIALEQWREGKEYVSTAYGFLALIATGMLVVYLVLNQFLNWNAIFNIPEDKVSLGPVMTLIIISYLFVFFFSLINSIAFAFQDAFIPGFLSLLTNTTIVALIFILGKLGVSGLNNLTIIYCSASLLVLICFNVYLLTRKYEKIRPSFTHIKKSTIGDIAGLGIKFFIIQFMAIAIFLSSSMVILQVMGPADVTTYQIVLKLFSVFTILSSLVMTPMWSAFTDAYAKKDYTWIKRTVKKLMFLMIPFTLCSAVLIIMGDFLIRIWLGGSFDISLGLYALMALYTLLTIWSSIFSYLLNGINKVNLQLITVIIGGVINIPLAVFFAKNLSMGIEGVVLATVCALSIFAIAGPIEVYYVFFRKKPTPTAIEGET